MYETMYDLPAVACFTHNIPDILFDSYRIHTLQDVLTDYKMFLVC